MMDEKKVKESQKRVKQYIMEGQIKTKQKVEHVDFFLKSANDSLETAKILYALSTDDEKQKYLGFQDFDGFLWVVNASYYSMFFIVRTLLEDKGIRIKSDLSVHAVTFDTLIHFFYLTGKLQKNFVAGFY